MSEPQFYFICLFAYISNIYVCAYKDIALAVKLSLRASCGGLAKQVLGFRVIAKV